MLVTVSKLAGNNCKKIILLKKSKKVSHHFFFALRRMFYLPLSLFIFISLLLHNFIIFLIHTTFVAWKYWFKLTHFRCFLTLYSLVFFLSDLNRTIIRPCALISWLKNLHRARLGRALTGRPRNAMLLTYLLSHAQHKTTNKPSSFRNKFWFI